LKKLNALGIGPKIAIVLFPWLAATLVFNSKNKPLFNYTPECSQILLVSGIILMLVGLIFYISTVRMLLKGLKETKLMTIGSYGFCQHLLYVSFKNLQMKT